MQHFKIFKFNIAFILALLFCSISCGQTNSHRKSEGSTDNITMKDTCADPDADINCYFINMPAKLTNVMNIAGIDEPGERLTISGTVFKSDGKTPYPDLIIYAYHTDNRGYYSKKGDEKGIQKWHGYLHGWCKTDSEGNYEINSIRPVRYPSNNAPAHIHAAIMPADGSEPFYINDFVFKDDNLVNQAYINTEYNVGGTGVLQVAKNEDGIWVGKRNLILDEN